MSNLSALKKYLQAKLPHCQLQVQLVTPNSMQITINHVKFPIFPLTSNFASVWETLINYCFSYSDFLTSDDENEEEIAEVINLII